MTRLFDALKCIWILLVAAVLCQTLVGAVAVVGWTYRLVRMRYGLADPAMAHLPETTSKSRLERVPNWIVRQRFRASLHADRSHSRGFWANTKLVLRSIAGSLWLNLKIGAQGLFNTFVWTSIPCLLWAFGWYFGWEVSFNKGYEQSFVGAQVALLGIALFVGVMFYLPLAQVRQAVTGEWRSFYQFHLVRAVARRQPFVMLILAAAYSVISLPVTILLAAPVFFPQINPEIESYSNAELFALAQRYYFWVGLIGFLLFVALRVLAARIYVNGMANLWVEDAVDPNRISESEREWLERITLGREREERDAAGALVVVRTVVSKPARWGLAAAAAIVWFTFTAQIFVREFLHNHEVRGWLNQPLVQAPWFRYIPPELAASARDEGKQ